MLYLTIFDYLHELLRLGFHLETKGIGAVWDLSRILKFSSYISVVVNIHLTFKQMTVARSICHRPLKMCVCVHNSMSRDCSAVKKLALN
jgi:hypothetical protein